MESKLPQHRGAITGLRPWQSAALDEWTQRERRGIVEVVTGGGKTRFALACIENVLHLDPKTCVVIIVPTQVLQDQWYANLHDDLLIPKGDISVWPDCREPNRRLQVMVVNTARTRMGEILKSHQNVMLVADECHRYASPANGTALAHRFRYTLGLTATAERQFDDGLERILIPNLGLVFFEYTIDQALSDGVVNPFSLANIRVPMTRDEKSDYDNITRLIGLASARDDLESVKRLALKRASIAKNCRARIPATVVLAAKLRRRRMLIFHEEIQQVRLLTSLLKRQGHRVEQFHSHLSRDMRTENLRMFRRGMLDILVCCRALDEGMDVPEAECAIIAASTSSDRQRIQRMGRVLRKAKGKGEASIFTLFASDSELETLKRQVSHLAGLVNTEWQEMRLPGVFSD